MLLLLWHSRSTLLTCHIAVVFCFCSSLQQGLTSSFLWVAVALWKKSWYCGFPDFVPPLTVVVYYIPTVVFLFPFYLILFLYSSCVFTWRALSVGKSVAWSVSLFLPQPLLPLSCLVSWYVPSHLQICLIFRNPAFPCGRALCIPCKCTCLLFVTLTWMEFHWFLSAVIVCSSSYASG